METRIALLVVLTSHRRACNCGSRGGTGRAAVAAVVDAAAAVREHVRLRTPDLGDGAGLLGAAELASSGCSRTRSTLRA